MSFYRACVFVWGGWTWACVLRRLLWGSCLRRWSTVAGRGGRQRRCGLMMMGDAQQLLSASCRLRVDVNGRSGDNEPNSLRLQSTRTSGRYHRWRRLFQMLVPNYHDITSTYTSATTASAAASAVTIIILRSPIIWKRINAHMQQLLLLLSLSLNVTIVNANDNDDQLFYYICSWNYRVNQTIARL